MRANYGYADASGEYYITVDTDRCDGCGECVRACPHGVLAIELDDEDLPKAVVKPELRRSLADLCPGFDRKCGQRQPNCHSVCRPEALRHSW
jgi:ferredoxin